MYQPPWCEEDREAVRLIMSLSDEELASRMLNGDPVLRTKIGGKFANPIICGYLEVNRPTAISIYQAKFRERKKSN